MEEIRNVLHFIQFLINNRRFREFTPSFSHTGETSVMSLADRSLVSKLQFRKIMTLE